MTRTKLIATLGPSSKDYETINNMVKLGVDAFRLNFSHGTLEEKKILIRYVRDISSKNNTYIPIIADLQGPVVRIFTDSDIEVIEGRNYRFSYKKGYIRIMDEKIFLNVDIGDILLVDDGKIRFKVIRRDKEHIDAKALVNGILHNKKKIFIKDKFISHEALTDKDINDLSFAIKNKVEYIALSMVNSPDDIKILREKVDELGGGQWILAKIESPGGVDNVNEIAQVSDGLMVARGDLGQYYPLEKIPILQKKIVYEGNKRGKITIVATQILESMLNNQVPTRAEVTDIFNSVGERVDAILLTGETAIGKYPIEAVKWASKVLSEADNLHVSEVLYYKEDFIESIFDKFARGVIYISHIINGKIIGFTKGGNTARRLSRYRPKTFIYVVTQNRDVAGKINLLYSIKPILVEENYGYWELLKYGRDKLYKEGFLRKGDIVIYTVGMRPEATDMVKVETI